MTSHESAADKRVKRLPDFVQFNELKLNYNAITSRQESISLNSGPKKERRMSLAMSTASIDFKRDPPMVNTGGVPIGIFTLL